MGYSVYDQKINAVPRDAGYGVPAYCDHPGCFEIIDRGMGYACCGDPLHTASCGGFYCKEHRYQLVYQDDLQEMSDEDLKRLGIDSREERAHDEDDGIIRCIHQPIELKTTKEWADYIAQDESWQTWRNKFPEDFKKLQADAAFWHAKAQEQHDNDAVDLFATKMKEKLAQARAKGRSGWQTCEKDLFSTMFVEHLFKNNENNLFDLANLLMFYEHLNGDTQGLLEEICKCIQAIATEKPAKALIFNVDHGNMSIGFRTSFNEHIEKIAQILKEKIGVDAVLVNNNAGIFQINEAVVLSKRNDVFQKKGEPCKHYSTEMFLNGRARCFNCDCIVNEKREIIRGEHG